MPHPARLLLRRLAPARPHSPAPSLADEVRTEDAIPEGLGGACDAQSSNSTAIPLEKAGISTRITSSAVWSADAAGHSGRRGNRPGSPAIGADRSSCAELPSERYRSVSVGG